MSGKTLALIAFICVLLAGLAAGLARDLYSAERAVVGGEIVEVNAGGQDYKSPAVRTANLKVRLTDGRTVTTSITEPQRFRPGATVALAEMVMPWGQVWYKLKGE